MKNTNSTNTPPEVLQSMHDNYPKDNIPIVVTHIEESIELFNNTANPETLFSRQNFGLKEAYTLKQLEECGLYSGAPSADDYISALSIHTDEQFMNCYDRYMKNARTELKTEKGIQERENAFWNVVKDKTDEATYLDLSDLARNRVKREPDKRINSPVTKTVPSKKKGHGCLISILIFFSLVCIGIYFAINQAGKIESTMSGQYIDGLTETQQSNIDTVLKNSGIKNVIEIKHDNMLDDAYKKGDKGYRINVDGDIRNVIMYLNADKKVYAINYAGKKIYFKGKQKASVNDYYVSMDEVNKYMSEAEEQIKGILKSPSTAKFPNYTEWGFEQNKNRLTIQGYVDSQNGFGAMIRSEFQFKVKMDSGTITSLIFDGEELINN